VSFPIKSPLTLCPACNAEPGQKCLHVQESGKLLELVMVHKQRVRAEQRAVYGKTVVMTADMTDDPRPLLKGTVGRVESMDDGGTLHVRWQNGRTLGVLPTDQYKLIDCCDELFPHESTTGLPAGEHWLKGVTKNIKINQVSETGEE